MRRLVENSGTQSEHISSDSSGLIGELRTSADISIKDALIGQIGT